MEHTDRFRTYSITMSPVFVFVLFLLLVQAMNISVTTLKRLCRRHGVKRWPHRQISGINRAMAHLEFQQDQAGRRADRAGGMRTANQVSDQMQELLRRRRVMIEVSLLERQMGNPAQRCVHSILDEGMGSIGDRRKYTIRS